MRDLLLIVAGIFSIGFSTRMKYIDRSCSFTKELKCRDMYTTLHKLVSIYIVTLYIETSSFYKWKIDLILMYFHLE